METWKTILQILSVVLLIVAIIYIKKPWGQKLLYFALGMIVAFALTDGFEGFVRGWEAQQNISN
jgi:lipoprotein signal peptidase